MIPRRSRMFLWASLQIALGWLLLTFLHEGAWGMISIGLLYGVMFGHTTLAAAWAALGPLPLLWRIPLSLAWVALIVTGLAAHLSIYGGPFDFVLIMAACLFGQWLVLQIPLSTLVLFYGLQLTHADHEAQQPASLQFGIRQLMIFTALVAILLAIGRATVALLGASENSMGGVPTGLIFLACAAVVMTLPLVLATLVPRWSVAAVMIVCSIMVAATVGETTLISTVQGAGMVGWDLLIWINAFSYAFIIAFIATVRLSGYRLSTGKVPTVSPVTMSR